MKEEFLALQDQLLLQEINTKEDQNIELKEEDSWDQNLVRSVKEITGYEFNDTILLQRAFTHHSYDDHCLSTEEFAYDGDAILGCLIAMYQRDTYPARVNRGQRTRLRSANVNTEKLARVVVKHELHKFLRHKKPLLEKRIKEFKNEIVEYPQESLGLVNAPKVLADIFESLIAAIFIDSNYSMDTTWKSIKKLLHPLITPSDFEIHPVTMLYEICQKNGYEVEMKDLWKETGEIEFFVNGEFVAKAKYSAKRVIAHNRAAKNAYDQIVKLQNMGYRPKNPTGLGQHARSPRVVCLLSKSSVWFQKLCTLSSTLIFCVILVNFLFKDYITSTL